METFAASPQQGGADVKSAAKDASRTPTPSSKQGSSSPAQADKSDAQKSHDSANATADAKPKKKRGPNKPKDPPKAATDSDAAKADKHEDSTPEKKPSKKKKKLADGSAGTPSIGSPRTEESKSPKDKDKAKAKEKEEKNDLEPYVMTNAQKKKFTLLQEQLAEEQKKQQGVKEKMDALNRKINAIKWPVKDQLVVPKLIALEEKKPKKDQKLPMEHQKIIPAPTVKLPLLDQSLASDALACWDFLNIFGKHLELSHMSLDEFIDLLQYRGQDSIAFVELFTAPLRVLVKDEELSLKVSLDIPFSANFARKLTAPELQVGALGSARRGSQGVSRAVSLSSLSGVGMDIAVQETPASTLSTVTQALADEHRLYSKTVSLLPRRLRIDQVDPLRWQAVCTAMLPHLPPVRAFLKLSLELQFLTTDHMALAASKALVAQSTLSGRELSNTSQRQRAKEEKKLLEDIQAASQRKESPEAIAQISNLLVLSNLAHRSRDLNIDSALCITSDVTERLQMLREAMSALHSDDLHKASAQNKLFILKMLFKSCYETEAWQEVIAENAEKLISLTEERKREDLERIRAKRAGSKVVQDRAIVLCREENKVIAEEKEKAVAQKAAKAAERAALLAEKAKSVEGSSTDAKAKAKPKAKGVKRSADGEVKEGEDAENVPANTGTEAKKKGPQISKAKQADPLHPSPNQLAAKVEELLFMDEIGIDEVMELGDDVLSEGDEDVVEIDGEKVVLGARQRGPASRAADAAREEKRKSIMYRNDQRQLATEQLQEAIESERESDLRRSIKVGQRAEILQWKEDDGKVYCTPLMFQAQRKLAEIEAISKSQKDDADFQRSLKQYTVRTEPLGFDRHGNSYWAFSGDEDRLYVCLQNEKKSMDVQNTGGLLSFEGKTNVPKAALTEVLTVDSALQKLFKTRPWSETGETWQIYGSEREIFFLWDALDDRGINERSLKAKIKSTFEFNKPIEYRADHEWIGRQIERVWPKHLRQKNSVGVIDGWLEEDVEEGDLALWHVTYSDGDGEELEDHEVKKFLISDDEKTETEKQEAKDFAAAQRMAADSENRRTSSRVSEIVSTAKIANTMVVDNDDTESEVEDDAPYVVLNYDNKNTNRTYRHVVTKPGMFGFRGLKREMKNFLTVIETGLKSADFPLSKEARNVLHKCIESAETVQALREALLSIEEAVVENACQDVVNIDDTEEALAEQERLHAQLRAQGWLFDKTESPHIGKSARRFFLRTGASDGVCTGIHRYVDAKTGVTTETFLVEHADGDTDEMEEVPLQLAIRAFELNQMTDISAATREEMNDDDDDDSDDEDEGYDQRDPEDMAAELDEQQDKMWTIEAEEDASVECIARLWPTRVVRNKWLQALREASCVADVAMATSAFHAQAVSFGVTGEDIFETMKEKAPHVIFRKPKPVGKPVDSRSRSSSSRSKGDRSKAKAKKEEDSRSCRRASRVNYNYD